MEMLMLEQITLRSLTEQDWQAYAYLRLAALKECAGFFGIALEEEKIQPPEFWQGRLAQNDAIFFGLFDNAKIIGIQGIAPFKQNDEAGIILGSYILPAYRGKRLSTKLYNACIDWAVNSPVWKKVVVSHREDNRASKGAIMRYGFKHTHRETTVWPDGKTVDNVFYELDLEKLRLKPQCKCCCR
jgi:RimJ/RimL family protein N-acetyltransferase